MHTQRTASHDMHENKRELVPSHPSPKSQEVHATEAAQESLLRGLDDNADYDAETLAIDDSTGRSRTSLDVSSYKSDASSVTNVPTLAGQPPISDSRKQTLRFTLPAEQILNGWWLEIFCCWLSIACVAALAVFLKAYDDQPLPEWPSGITVNTVVALLSTVTRTAFTIPVAEGLSQCKWNWFKQKPRPLSDLDLFDQASRGPWGSLSLMVRTKGWLIGIFSAVLLVSSIGTSTLTQSAVTYPTRKIQQRGEAPAWSLSKFDYQGLTYELDYATAKLREVMSSPFTTPISFKEPRCPQSDYITDVLRPNLSASGLQTNLQLPNGVSMTVINSPRDEQTVVGSGPRISDYDTDVLNSIIFVYSAIYSDWVIGSEAAEVAFHWCVNTYDASVENNVLLMKHNLSHTQSHRFNANYSEMTTPADNNPYPIYQTEVWKIGEILREAATGNSSVSNQTRTGGERLQRAINETRLREDINFKAGSDVFWSVIDSTAQIFETVLVNSFLMESKPNVMGVAWNSESFIRVRWPWLTFLIVQVGLSFIILMLIILETATAGVDVVKSSTLPSLFAINSEAKADLEHKFEEGEPLVEKGHRRVVPWGIGGQLHKVDGKWQLRSARE
ncbi:hypothetical protein CSOJ01_03923 [Colletotrichum sojae]|uniref:Uncharacterized protein n=1 Tax=Colletotrichum sojae TaxID=2175907 RepID=A0A8H6N095_9PEZI|nr:hypothetical protein CSOJ01_03923 [Colletotrichum sojae]